MTQGIPRDIIEWELTSRFRKRIWSPFLSAVSQYGMVQPGDRIAVCMSGGKDSLLMAKCLQTLKKYSKMPFDLVYLSMDPGYQKENRDKFLKAAALLGIAPEVFHTDIYSIVDQAAHSSCHICAAMRRGYLYKEAKLRDCNKIALGHHYDDAAETILLSILYGGQYKAMLPRLKSDNFQDMELIRPLYHVREQTVKVWLESTGIETISCACSVTKKLDGGKRARVKRLIEQLEKELPNVAANIIASSFAVNLSNVLGYREPEGDKVISFMDSFAGGKKGKEQDKFVNSLF